MKEIQDINSLYQEVREIIASARQNAVRSVDFCRVQMYWQIGRRILEEEQKGKERLTQKSKIYKFEVDLFGHLSEIVFKYSILAK